MDRGAAVIFHTDSGLCLSYIRIVGPKRNLDHRSFFILSHLMLMSSSKLFLVLNEAHLSSGIHCETVIVAVLCFSHHTCCLLYIWAKLTVAFTCTSLRFNLYTSIFRCGCGFGFEQKFWWVDGFCETKARNSGFAFPYPPPS